MSNNYGHCINVTNLNKSNIVLADQSVISIYFESESILSDIQNEKDKQDTSNRQHNCGT